MGSRSSLVPEDLSSLPPLLPRMIKDFYGEDGQREGTDLLSCLAPSCSFLKAQKMTKDANSIAICPGCWEPERRIRVTQAHTLCQVGSPVFLAQILHRNHTHFLRIAQAQGLQSTGTPHTHCLPECCMSETLLFLTVICSGKLGTNIHKSQTVN